MMKIVGVITARMTSSRLPGKCLLDLGGKPSIDRHVERLRMVEGIDNIYIATSRATENKVLHDVAEGLGIGIYAGEDEDVVERYIAIGDLSSAYALVRVGCDKPLFCYELLANSVANYKGEDYIYFKQGMPVGVGSEILSLTALKEVHKHYKGTAISKYIREYPHKFVIKAVVPDSVYMRPEYRIALDTQKDYELLRIVFEDLGSEKLLHTKDVLSYLDDNPEVALINCGFEEKNVNTYSLKLEREPVFKVYLRDDGKYFILDRMNNEIPYGHFLSDISDIKRWKSE